MMGLSIPTSVYQFSDFYYFQCVPADVVFGSWFGLERIDDFIALYHSLRISSEFMHLNCSLFPFDYVILALFLRWLPPF